MDEQKLDIKLGEWAGVVHFGLHFTKSLDACFKWLVPNAIEKFEEVKMLELFMNWGLGLIDCKEPTLALCLAIEKLIDGDNEN